MVSSAARVFELNADLPQLVGEQTRQVRDRKKRKQIDENNRLQRLQSGMESYRGRNDSVVVQFQHGPVENERQRRHQSGPDAGQQYGGNDDDKGIEEVQELSQPPVSCTTRVTRTTSVRTCKAACSRCSCQNESSRM